MSIRRYINIFVITFLIFTKNFILQIIRFNTPFSLHLLYYPNSVFKNGSLRYYDLLKRYLLFTLTNFPWRPLTNPQDILTSTDSAIVDPDCFPTTVSQRYPQLSKVFDHPLNEEAAQSTTFISMKRYRHSSQKNNNLHFMIKLPLPQKFMQLLILKSILFVITHLQFKNCLTSSKKLGKRLNRTELKILNCLILKF